MSVIAKILNDTVVMNWTHQYNNNNKKIMAKWGLQHNVKLVQY